MATQFKPRYEFRVFARDLSLLAEVMDARASQSEEEERSAELYICSRLTIDANVKIRDAELDIKILKERHGLLELWEPLVSKPLPVESRLFATMAAANLGLNLALPREMVVDLDAIIDICQMQPALQAVAVAKRRRKLLVDQVTGEITQVTISGEQFDTLAIESEAAPEVARVVGSIGLDALPNESYPAFLQRHVFD